MINPKLNEGDRIILFHMEDDSPVPIGTKGTVIKKIVLFGDVQYEVEWDNGSNLSLIDGIDKWTLLDDFEKRRKIKLGESDNEIDRFKSLSKNINIFKFFNWKFLQEYLRVIRESGITNMFAAAPYLYMGSERIKHEFKYQPIHDEDAFDKVIEMANQAQAEMINGTIKVLESKNIEPDLDQINRYLPRLSRMILENYMLLF
jgi:hypothetical protein